MIIDPVVEADIFTAKELDQVNRVRHHKKVTTVADLTCCDGSTIKSDIYTSLGGKATATSPDSNQLRATFANKRFMPLGHHKVVMP